MSYPDTVDSFPTWVDNQDTVFAKIPNDIGVSITNIKTALGIHLSNISMIGEVRLWAGLISEIPSGWLHCDGSAISRTTYADLYAITSTGFGAGDTTTTFNIPDTRDVLFVGTDADDTGIAKSNVSGSAAKTGGSNVVSTSSADTGSQSGGNATTGTHNHTFYLPYIALVAMIRALNATVSISSIEIFITLVDNIDIVYAAHHNERADSLIDIENAIGVNLSNTKIAGEVRAWGGSIANIPSGWLHCDGSTKSKVSYPDVYSVIRSMYGSADVDFVDSANGGSANPYTITVNGFVYTSSVQKVFGDASAKFDGSTGYLQFPDNGDWQFGAGTGNFSIDFRCRFATLPADGSKRYYYSQRVDSSNYIVFYFERSGANYYWHFEVVSGGVSLLDVQKQHSSPAVDTWYHIALTRGQSGGNNFRIAVNGTQIGTTTTTVVTIPNLAANPLIGSLEGSSGFIDGYLDEYRLKEANPFTMPFTPTTVEYGTDSSTLLLLHCNMNGNFVLPNTKDVFIVGAKQDDGTALTRSAKTNYEGSLLKTGGNANQPPLTNAGGGNESTNSGGTDTMPSHTHTCTPPYLATAFMIKT